MSARLSGGRLRRDMTWTVLVPSARCHQDWLRVTLSISSSASSSMVRLRRLTTSRKSVNAYEVPGRFSEMGSAGEEDHRTCSQARGNASTVRVVFFPNLRDQQDP